MTSSDATPDLSRHFDPATSNRTPASERRLTVALHGAEIDDALWSTLARCIQRPTLPPPGKGRPPVSDRRVLGALLHVLATGANWSTLPEGAPSRSTCLRRQQRWAADGTLAAVLRELGVRVGAGDASRPDWRPHFATL